jgi:hypothetical protein
MESVEPSDKKSVTDCRLPMVTTDRMDSVDPSLVAPRDDSDMPITRLVSTLTPDPVRMKLLNENVEPSVTASKTESWLPNIPFERRLTVEPSEVSSRTERDFPNLLLENTLMPEPKQATLRIDSALPTVTKLITLHFEPNLLLERKLMVDPIVESPSTDMFELQRPTERKLIELLSEVYSRTDRAAPYLALPRTLKVEPSAV